MNPKLKVVFVSPDGPGRSQMAAALLASAAAGRVDARFYAEGPGLVDEDVVSALAEVGIDARKRCVATDLEDEHVDLVVLVDRLRCSATAVDVSSRSLPRGAARVLGGRRRRGAPPRLGWPVEDPALARGEVARRLAFRRARFELTEHIDVLVGHGYLDLLRHALGHAPRLAPGRSQGNGGGSR